MHLRVRYSSLLDRHPASASGRIFFLSPSVAVVKFKTWTGSMDHNPVLQVTLIGVYLLRERLIKRVEEIRRDDFEAMPSTRFVAHRVVSPTYSLEQDILRTVNTMGPSLCKITRCWSFDMHRKRFLS
eukprot:GFKZ01004539.1.p1 GENE.GFKZ01004539.1~~GFKZ01004539.1.p1  ORF type:complete len:127 (-),score=9.94 GFKZ01004539.1:296-676(-)